MHTNDFGGTSSATPLAAGIAALVLSANGKLTRGEVRAILQETADKIGPASSYNSKGFSTEFGFGRVNAARAVAQALANKAAAKLAKTSDRKTRVRGQDGARP